MIPMIQARKEEHEIAVTQEKIFVSDKAPILDWFLDICQVKIMNVYLWATKFYM